MGVDSRQMLSQGKIPRVEFLTLDISTLNDTLPLRNYIAYLFCIPILHNILPLAK